MNVATFINHFDSNFTATNDEWAVSAVVYDSVHFYADVLGLQYSHGNKTMYERFYSSGILLLNQTIPVDVAHLMSGNASVPGEPFSGPILARQFLDMYADKDSGQIIIYTRDTAHGILFAYNMAPYPVSNFTPNDLWMVWGGQFSGLNVDTQQGQEFQRPQPSASVQVVSSSASNCGPVIQQEANISQSITGPLNNGTNVMLHEVSVSANP